MEADYGLRIHTHGYASATSNNAYNFGQDDFTITALFQSRTGGAIIARKNPVGGANHGGFWIIIYSDGRIVFNQDDGFGTTAIKQNQPLP